MGKSIIPGFKVVVKPTKVMGEYIALHGMVPQNELPKKLRRKIPKDEVWIRRDVYKDPIRRQKILCIHEKRELHLMKGSKIYTYKKAHKEAELREKAWFIPLIEQDLKNIKDINKVNIKNVTKKVERQSKNFIKKQTKPLKQLAKQKYKRSDFMPPSVMWPDKDVAKYAKEHPWMYKTQIGNAYNSAVRNTDKSYRRKKKKVTKKKKIKGNHMNKKYPKCVGSKIRSKGKGRGLGTGRGKGPLGTPVGAKPGRRPPGRGLGRGRGSPRRRNI